MSAPKPFEAELLEPVEVLLRDLAAATGNASFESRLQFLEAAASSFGHFPLEAYHATFETAPIAAYETLQAAGDRLVAAIRALPFHPAIALSALAREPLTAAGRRSSGAYYTDFRLAQYLAELGEPALQDKVRVVDPACGSGILLAAVSVKACAGKGLAPAAWLANNVYACDLSPAALRGARLALASLTDDLNAISTMWSHWRVHDSLMAPLDTWRELAPKGFDLVLGNPPWEKPKLSRHEFLRAAGVDRHYGDDYEILDDDVFWQERQSVSQYAERLNRRYDQLGEGEADLYMAFVQLSAQLVRPGGWICLLVPAGLIRSQGTERLRRFIFGRGRQITITVMENRARFFEIDTRFKFLSVSFAWLDGGKDGRRSKLHLHHAVGTSEGIRRFGSACIPHSTLSKIRPDLSIPEVRNDQEWKVFSAMVQRGVNWSDSGSAWYPHLLREVDMSNDRPNFKRQRHLFTLPVIEGRMVQPHRFGAKAYRAGTGRRAIWSRLPPGHSSIEPQFWIDQQHLSEQVAARCQRLRVGFCDIAGQTNERSMMAAVISPGVVCGNKVPTIVFRNDPSEERLYLWVGIANSLPFDWMLRRVLTTTINFFLLLGLPLPQLEPFSKSGKFVAEAALALRTMDTVGVSYDTWHAAKLRADIDIAVLQAYGLHYRHLELMLADFPQLDRRQPPINGEEKSTVTHDFLLLRAAHTFKRSPRTLAARVEAARSVGAVPYIPSEMVFSSNNEKGAHTNDDGEAGITNRHRTNRVQSHRGRRQEEVRSAVE
jgi:SAM-dependent methyltransferase